MTETTREPIVLATPDNGAELLAINKFYNDYNSAIVLCKYLDQYVTWHMNTNDGHCYWGHYFNTYKEGLTDYVKRIQQV